MKNFENIDELIAKVLSKEASREEITVLESWAKESAENKTYIEETKKLFAEIDKTRIEVTVNTNAAWEKLNRRIIEKEKEPKIIPLFNRTIFRAAASILLLVSLGFVLKYFFNPNEAQPQLFASSKSTVKQKLPDGSDVFLNKNSEISYVVTKDNVRQVKLKGEAFFEVVHNEKQLFVIEIGDIFIKDIGTAFNVKALPESELVEVLVESGEVQFYSTDNTGILLVKGEKATYNKTTKVFTKNSIGAIDNTISYKSKVFRFNGTPLIEVINQVNSVYGSQIKLSDQKLNDCRLSVRFNNETIDSLLSIIAETLNLEVVRSGETIVLKGESCSQ